MKICGVTRPEDALAAVRAGADAVGVVLAPSSRQISLSRAAEVFDVVPPLVTRVGVFVDPDPDYVVEAVARLGLGLVQLSGHEPPGICEASPVPVLKAMHIGTAFDSDAAEPYRGLVAAFLLDTLAKDRSGGTGNVFDWHLVHEFPAWAPMFIAGGLTPANVGAAIRALHPFAVDVSSGVETSPGLKDHAEIQSFVSAVAAADAEVYQR